MPSRFPYIIFVHNTIHFFPILLANLAKVRCRILLGHVCHVDYVDFGMSLFVLLDHESFEGLLVFQTCLLLDGYRWNGHLLLDSADGALSDRWHHIALDEELLDGFYQVFLHLAIVMGHTCGHDEFRRTATVLVQGDGVGLVDDFISLSVNDQGRASDLFNQFDILKSLSDDK